MNKKYKSANLVAYPSLGQVRAKNKVIRLGPVNMRVLIFLMVNHGKVVSRTDIFDAVWKNQVISDDALTRCISDLRTQLKTISAQEKLIATIPKRGYQWLVETSEFSESTTVAVVNKKPLLYWVFIGVFMLAILSTGLLWFADQLIKTQQIKIAFIALQTNNSTKNLSSDLEDMLRSKILATDRLRFLSKTILTEKDNTPFIYLAREHDAQWIVEGRLREYNGSIKITLNLVDTRSAMVFHEVSSQALSNKIDLEAISNLFVANMVDFSKTNF